MDRLFDFLEQLIIKLYVKSMRKQFLQNFSTEFPNELNCSSIRIQPQQQHPQGRQEKKSDFLTVGPRLKKYEENDLVGFEMSLQMNDYNQKCRELMRSKSVKDYKMTQLDRLQKSKKLKEGVSIRENSLYNTTSFDQVTMNITTNTKNITTHNQTFEQDKNNSRTLKKPNQLTNNREAFPNLSIKINTTTNTNANTTVSTKPLPDIKNKNTTEELIASLKVSMAQQQPNKSYEETSYEQPYFKVGSTRNILPPPPTPTPSSENIIIKDHRKHTKKNLNIETSRSNQGKLTLRDYIYLSKLTGKTRQKSTECQSPRSPKNITSNSRTRRNGGMSNSQVMSQLTKEVVSNIELVQGNMSLILEYVKSCRIEEEMSHKQMMNMYNLARLLREKMVAGNDQLVMMLQQLSKQ